MPPLMCGVIVSLAGGRCRAEYTIAPRFQSDGSTSWKCHVGTSNVSVAERRLCPPPLWHVGGFAEKSCGGILLPFLKPAKLN